MKFVPRAIAIGALSLSTIAVMPAVASADTTSSIPGIPAHLQIGGLSIDVTASDGHMYITLTTSQGSITIDPPIAMS
ncbi:hypothetical protein [Alicyclobacillus fodiniaquatilis]|uniref:Uncharacterized protein n=1 Tax=Alicyclobacillus fodiniaquatilis TaxID=1661150 RepID=A0ABW4JLA6_9BACL